MVLPVDIAGMSIGNAGQPVVIAPCTYGLLGVDGSSELSPASFNMAS